MPIEIKVSAEVMRARQALSGLAQRQLPFATAVAINDVAFQVQRAERAHIGTTFKHPRPFTERSVLVSKATKVMPAATVFIRPEVAKYLDPYEFGGRHVLPGKALLNPINVRLDQYGQIRRGALKRLYATPTVFVGTEDGVRGFWRRLRGGKLVLLVRFGDAVVVHQRLGFADQAQKTVTRTFRSAFDSAIARALASARP